MNRALPDRCQRCGRKMNDINSRILGMGPACRKKAQLYAERFEMGLFAGYLMGQKCPRRERNNSRPTQ